MKIKSMKSLGVKQTYSIEMKSSQHNYLTGTSSVVHKNSHGCAYTLVAFKCLWLKAFFPEEWWSSVMSYCNADKLIRYMNVAREDGVKFAPIDINKLGVNFTAVPEKPRLKHTDPPNGYVMPGLICLKGVGGKVASQFANDELDQEEQAIQDNISILVDTELIESIDDFVDRKGKNKVLMERLIKLGSFKQLPLHDNSRAVWIYYQCKYCTGTEINVLKNEIKTKTLELDGWNEQTVNAERQRQADEYKAIYPKRKVPDKILKWKPKPEITLQNIIKIYPNDFTLAEILKFEEQFLGYHIHSPLDLFITRGSRSINDAKMPNGTGGIGEVEAVIIEPPFYTKTKTNQPMCKLMITDGIRTVPMIIWSDELLDMDRTVLRTNLGIRAKVKWDNKRRNFTLASGHKVIGLKRKDAT